MIICITGIDGCGKGTQKELLATRLQNAGKTVFLSKAYGDAEKECFSAFMEYWSQESILFAFQALHVEQRVRAKRAEARGEIVIADRWDESYVAYHTAYGILENDPTLRDRLNEIAFAGIVPDHTFFLDVSVEEAEKRLVTRGMDFFDKRGVEYHNTMRSQYLRIAAERGWSILDGGKSAVAIHHEILKVLGL